MANQKERYCSGCDRIYSWDDWQEDTCPFCDAPLTVLGASADPDKALVEDTISLNVPWPQGEGQVEVYRAQGYLDAQMLKAQLEGSGIPVVLGFSTTLGFTVGDLGIVPVFVPQSRLEDARDVIESTQE